MNGSVQDSTTHVHLCCHFRTLFCVKLIAATGEEEEERRNSEQLQLFGITSVQIERFQP